MSSGSGYSNRGRGGKQVPGFNNNNAPDTSINSNKYKKNNIIYYENNYRSNGEFHPRFGSYRGSYGKFNYLYRGKSSFDQNGSWYYPRNHHYYAANKHGAMDESKSNKKVLRKPIQLNDKIDYEKLNKKDAKITILDKNGSVSPTSETTKTKIFHVNAVKNNVTAKTVSDIAASSRNSVETANEVFNEPTDNDLGKYVGNTEKIHITNNKIDSEVNKGDSNTYENTQKITICHKDQDNSEQIVEKQKLANTVAIPDEYKPRSRNICSDCKETYYVDSQVKTLTENSSKECFDSLGFDNSTCKDHPTSSFTSDEDEFSGKEALIKGLASILLEEEKSSDKLGKALQNVLNLNKQQQQRLEFNPSVLPPPPYYIPMERNNIYGLLQHQRYYEQPTMASACPKPLATLFYPAPVMLPVNVFQYSMQKDITSPLSVQTMDFYHQENYYTGRVLQKVSTITAPPQQFSPFSHNYTFAPFTNVTSQQQLNKTSPSSDWSKQCNVKTKNDFVIKPTNKKQLAMHGIQSKKVVLTTAPSKEKAASIGNGFKYEGNTRQWSAQDTNVQENYQYVPFSNFFDDFYGLRTKNAYRNYRK